MEQLVENSECGFVHWLLQALVPHASPQPNPSSQEAAWMRDRLRWELENGGLDCEESLRIGTACAEACTKLFASGFGQFDPMVIMDVMEEEVERRDLRGDFLPFELSHKALQVLQRLWDGSKRPEAVENKLDVVDFDKLPKSEA